MKIGFDIGGVLSKYPEKFDELIESLNLTRDDTYINNHLYVISDMHPKEQIVKVLKENGFIDFPEENIYSADYEKYGSLAKAILIRDLGIDLFIDDFDGYLQWDSSFGPQPILLKVMPDGFKPYWADSWKCDGGDFGRRYYKTNESSKYP